MGYIYIYLVYTVSFGWITTMQNLNLKYYFYAYIDHIKNQNMWESDEMVIMTGHGEGDTHMKVPVGLITRSRAKKLRESLQVLVHAVKDQVGQPMMIEGLEHQDKTIYTLFQVSEVEENDFKVGHNVRVQDE